MSTEPTTEPQQISPDRLEASLQLDIATKADIEPMLTLQIRLPRSLLDRIDNYRLATVMRPPRSMMIRLLCEQRMTSLELKEVTQCGRI